MGQHDRAQQQRHPLAREASDNAGSGPHAWDEGLYAVVWSGGRFVAVGENGRIVHSADGDRWGERAVDGATFDWLSDVAWNGERFVAVGHNGTIVVSP